MGKCLFMRKGEVHTDPGYRLPNGYTELSNIQSTGTQYIDTGFKPNQDTRVIMDIDVLSYPNAYPCIFGTRGANWQQNSYAVFAVQNNNGFQDQYANEVYYSQLSIIGRHTIDKNKNETKRDGIVSKTFLYTSFRALQNLLLLNSQNPSGSEGFECAAKLYSCQIYDNGTLIRDFLPCISNTGAVGLYDLVGKKFYGNVGTGVFTGSEVP